MSSGKNCDQQRPGRRGPLLSGDQIKRLYFCLRSAPIDTGSGKLLEGSIADQTDCIMNNISEILREAGSGLHKIVKTTILAKDLTKFQEINEAYGRFFKGTPPARACCQVAELPKNAELEIEVICEA